MTPDELQAEKAKAKKYLIATVMVALLFAWITLDCFHTAHRQLSSLVRVSGPLRTAVVRRTTGKNEHYYLEFSLVNQSQTFIISEYLCRQPLADLQQAMQRQQQAQPGTPITVYYDLPAWWAGSTTFDVYQVELPYEVIYPIDEVRQWALGQAALVLLVLFVSTVVGLSQYLAHRASAEANF